MVHQQFFLQNLEKYYQSPSFYKCGRCTVNWPGLKVTETLLILPQEVGSKQEETTQCLIQIWLAPVIDRQTLTALPQTLFPKLCPILPLLYTHLLPLKEEGSAYSEPIPASAQQWQLPSLSYPFQHNWQSEQFTLHLRPTHRLIYLNAQSLVSGTL